MTSQQIEALMIKMGLHFKRIIKDLWEISDPEGKIPQISVCLEPSLRKGEKLLKFMVFICDVPKGTPIDFFKEFLKLNFRMEHGAFVMETHSEMFFIDTLEVANMDDNEFEETYKVMCEAPRMFQERYDIDFYTLGNPQF